MRPVLPTLFFQMLSDDTQPVLSAAGEGENDSSTTVEIPTELLHRCLIEYADWGDLAKLANVQKGWSNIMYEAANESQEAKWQLAQNLLEGSAGLEQNFDMAFRRNWPVWKQTTTICPYNTTTKPQRTTLLLLLLLVFLLLCKPWPSVTSKEPEWS